MNDLFQGMEYVYAVYKEKSFSAAAKKLFISQPSLSITVKRIEKRIGYPLFDRSTKPLSLTECGKAYIAAAEQILAAQDSFSNFLNDWDQLKTGSLVLGGSSLYSSQVLPGFIRRFSKLFPGVQVSLVEGSSKKLQAMLDEGDIDIIIDNFSLDPDIYDKVTVKEERLFLAVPAKFEINQKLQNYRIPAEAIAEGPTAWSRYPTVPLTEFQGEPFVFLKSENDTGRRSSLLCNQAGLTPNVLFFLDQQLTSYQITRSGLAVSFLSDTLISKMDESERMVYYNLDPAYCCRQLYFYWKKARSLSRAGTEFIDTAKQIQQ